MGAARARTRGAVPYMAAVVLACALGGCVAAMNSLPTANIGNGRHRAARPGTSRSGATIAFASLEGPPSALAARFVGQFAAAAASRKIVTADPRTADYLMRGYLSAYEVPKGTAITCVWDIFDNQKRHAERLENTITLKKSTSHPWSVANKAVIASLAAKSADDLAAYLSTTPQAIAAGSRASAALAAAPARLTSPATRGSTPQTVLSVR